MYYLPLTLDSLAENLALDEALLDAAETGELDAGVLRVWESPCYGVVLGRSSQPEVEVNQAACRQDDIQVYRRSSGGGTVLAGPGCLMYALVLDFETFPFLQAIDEAHRFVLKRMANILSSITDSVDVDGISDLVLRKSSSANARKFSGNAMRSKRRNILYHGTFLYDFDLERISRWLAAPTRTPAYRSDRDHGEFVTNLPISRETIQAALCDGWQATETLSNWPEQATNQLIETRYRDDPKWVIHSPSK